ncbi:MAG: hypothetical protein JO317_08955 [Verrucomicrobiae bacterium]|nr:hypothetical protein [Verrucomicrobiae bacterium]
MFNPSRKFKENFVVAGCFSLSALTVIIVLAMARVWWFLPLAVILLVFLGVQGWLLRRGGKK